MLTFDGLRHTTFALIAREVDFMCLINWHDLQPLDIRYTHIYIYIYVYIYIYIFIFIYLYIHFRQGFLLQLVII